MSATQEILQRVQRVLMTTYDPPPIVLARGDGVWAYDLDGNRYLDFAGGLGVNILGHCHGEVTAAIQEQSAALAHTSNLYLHAGHVQLGARLCAVTGLDRVFLCNSGTEAVEAALKLARRFHHERGDVRTEFVATRGAFHGRTLGALSVTGQPVYQTGFGPLLTGVHHVPFADIDAMRNVVGPRTAAVIIEPIQGNSGVLLPPPGYLAALRDLCESASTLLIIDEIQTGMGRTGEWFAYQHAEIQPDIVTLAKAVGGGLPLGAMLARESIAKAFVSGAHGTTFGGNPVACAAGLKTLDVIGRDGLLHHATRLGREALAMYQELRTLPDVVEVRGLGFMIGIELRSDVGPLREACRKRGLLVTAAGKKVVRLLPPLIAQREHFAEALVILRAALAAS